MFISFCFYEKYEFLNLVLQAKPDSVGFADDWGTQRALMVNPEFWRSFFKPRYEKMFKIVRDHGAYVQFHSDGVITDIILDLSEIGVNQIYLRRILLEWAYDNCSSSTSFMHFRSSFGKIRTVPYAHSARFFYLVDASNLFL
ncbi:MAG: hypothetical protein ACUVTL_09300 [Thermoproteota archaeon]